MENSLVPAHSGKLPASHVLGNLDLLHTQKMKLVPPRRNQLSQEEEGPNAEFYFPAGKARPRSSLQYAKIGTGLEDLSGKPVSVQVLEGTGVKLRCSGLPLTAKPEDPSEF